MIFKNKILLRFFFILSCLLIFPFPFNISYFNSWAQDTINSVYHKLIPWIGKHILNLNKDITQFSGGSGDTTYDYVLLLFFIFCAIVGTLIWTLIIKKERGIKKLNYIFSVILRYYLGTMMLSYGLAKIIPPRQFPELSFFRLLQPYGESSPMGLLWTFMGASQGYTIFSGVAELIGGLLLFHRKTRLLGALILIPVLTNVVALNLFYDVPVKLFSIQLLLFAIFLTLPDVKRLINLIVLNKQTKPNNLKKFFNTGKKRIIRICIKYGLLLTIFGFLMHNIIETISWAEENGYGSKKPRLYGVYKVVKENTTSLCNWNYIRFQYNDLAHFHENDLNITRYKSKIDSLKNEINLISETDSTKTFKMIYKESDSLVIFTKIVGNDTLIIPTTKMTENSFLLVNRGFHWINEVPFNE